MSLSYIWAVNLPPVSPVAPQLIKDKPFEVSHQGTGSSAKAVKLLSTTGSVLHKWTLTAMCLEKVRSMVLISCYWVVGQLSGCTIVFAGKTQVCGLFCLDITATRHHSHHSHSDSLSVHASLCQKYIQTQTVSWNKNVNEWANFSRKYFHETCMQEDHTHSSYVCNGEAMPIKICHASLVIY